MYALDLYDADDLEETRVVVEVLSMANDKTASLAEDLSAKFSASVWNKE